jgi:transcriptional regulator with XRE-family HTH domain
MNGTEETAPAGKTLAQLITEARSSCDLTQKQLAAQMGVSQAAVMAWEHGHIPTRKNVIRLQTVLAIPIPDRVLAPLGWAERRLRGDMAGAIINGLGPAQSRRPLSGIERELLDNALRCAARLMMPEEAAEAAIKREDAELQAARQRAAAARAARVRADRAAGGAAA